MITTAIIISLFAGIFIGTKFTEWATEKKLTQLGEHRALRRLTGKE